MSFDYKDWYQENKKVIARKRKLKYHKDAEYRTLCKERARDYYNRNERRPLEARFFRRVNGVDYITIGKLAKIIKRTTQTIRQYHDNCVIPEVNIVDSRGWRLYTLEQARIISSVFARYNKDKIRTLKEVSDQIKKKWKE